MSNYSDEYFYDAEIIAIARAISKQCGWDVGEEAYPVIASPNTRPMHYWRMALVASEAATEFRKERGMKLFKISNPDEDVDYDCYRSAVVIARDEAEARLIHPDPGHFWIVGLGWRRYMWSMSEASAIDMLGDCARGKTSHPDGTDESGWMDPSPAWPSDPGLVIVEYLGESNEGVRRVVVSDFFHG